MKNAKWLIITALAVILIGGMAYRSATASREVRAARVERGAMQTYVEEKGRTSIPRLHQITMPMAGRILPIDVAEGDTVKAGQIVAHMDDADWTDAMKEADNMVSAMYNAVTAMTAKIAVDQTAMEFSKWVWDAKTALFNQSQTSEIEAKQSSRDYHIDQANLEEDLATQNALQAFLAITKLMPIFVTRQLGKTRIAAPADGVVLKRHVWNERYMQPGEALLDLGDLSTLEVTADLLTEQAVTVQTGDAVVLYGETIGEQPLKGKVRLVEPMGFAKTSSLGVEQQRVAVRISLDTASYEAWKAKGRILGLGFRVQVKVITETKEQALMVPRTALFRNNQQQWQAYVIEAGKARLVTLTLGLLNDEQAEVVSGLNEGDQVIIAPDASIVHGARVHSS